MLELAREERNQFWKQNPLIPNWVDPANVDLDQFFTKTPIAKYCHEKMLEVIGADGAEVDNYNFVEPSAGMGAFFQFLPKDSRIGIDIMPLCEDLIRTDFLSWMPPENGKSLAVIGNPPFGYRGWLALAFLNHAAHWADYVGFILPMAFQSEGKGSPKNRVKGLRLVHSEQLPQDSFIDINGNTVKINAMWQVWQRGVNNPPVQRGCNNVIDLFTVDKRKERLCGQARLNEANYFLQRTFFKEPPKLVRNFDDVKYVCGYGIIIKKYKDIILDVLNNTDWTKYSNLAAHNCRHISMYHIRQTLIDAGFGDD